MSTPEHVARRFEDYLRHEGAVPFKDGSTCPGCLEHPTAYKIGLHNTTETLICECCLRHFHGHDVAEETAVRALLGGAVRAALQIEVDVALIRATVDAVIDDEIEREARYFATAGRG